MTRPDFVTEEDITRWLDNMERDERLPKVLLDSPVIKEVCFAGLWLCERLEQLGCPDELIVRIQFTAGKLSFGREPWEVVQNLLDGYRNNELEFESDSSDLN